jgi:nucleotide sugar dehydrogenase
LSVSSILDLKPEQITRRLRNGDLTIGVIGLGWMGLPTACLFAEAGARVIGVDQNSRIVEKVGKGNATIDEPGLPELLKRVVREGRLKTTSDAREAASICDVIFIIVPTSIDGQKKPEYLALEDVSQEIGKGLRQGSLIVFESTVAPGITERIGKANLEKYSGLKAGEGFGLAYSPIRAMAGRALQDLRNYDRVVGGIDSRSLEAACAVLSGIVKGKLIRVRDLRTAEASKIFESVYRDVNIALANELAIFCEEIGIDYVEVMHAANSQPYSHLHVAGPGVGGHCIPVYPYLLIAEADSLDLKLRVLREAREVNEHMPNHTVKLVATALRLCGKTLKRSRVTILGISYRPGVKELRNSPALEIASQLKRRGARITIFDPKYTASEIERMGFTSAPSIRRAVEKADCVLLTVAHEEFRKLKANELTAGTSKPSAVVDCANIMDPLEVEKSGSIYRGIGRGIWTR